jgi:glycosyltransferase involved in cell wall biosynthesis
MNILFITHHFLVGVGGGTFASKAYINAFAKNASNMTLLFPYKAGKLRDIDSSVIIKPIKYDIPKALKFVDILTGHVHRYYRIFEKEIQYNSYDIVIFDNSRVSYKMIEIAHKYNAKVITIHHNYEIEYISDNEKGILRTIDLYWARKYEKDAVILSDISLTLTSQDKDLLHKHYDSEYKHKIEALGCFEYKYNPICELKSINNDQNVFIITGSLCTLQTEKSLLRWISTYYLLLENNINNLHLIIAGKSPSVKLIDICRHRKIEIISSPESLSNLLQKANFYICPIELGGGIKLRIMDGLSYGLPILVHESSARGYDKLIDKCLFVYKDKTSFIFALQKLIKCKYTHQEIIELYKEQFSFKSGIERVSKILDL